MAITEAELSGRVVALRKKMREADLDALIVFSDEYRSGHSTYLTNYKPINVIEESPQVVFLVGDAPPVVLLGRLNTYAAIESSWLDDFRPVHRAPEIVPELFAPIADRRSRVGLIGKNLLPVALFETFRDAAPLAEFVPADPLILSLRAIKSDAEITLMERAAEINDEVLRRMVSDCRVGMSEIQVAGRAEAVARELGADIGSATVVMSGPNTNFPAWRPTDRRVESGEFLLIDFNPAVQHYCNDGGITLLMPGAGTEQKEALETGHRVLKEVVPLLRAGESAASVHRLMLERLAPRGYAANFEPYAAGLRGVGHGVGLDVVEPPNLGPESDFALAAGMTLAVKLDLHGLAGGGYRVEVVVAITESGVRPLNKLVLAQADDFAILD